MSRPKPVRSFSRGLEVLRVLNERNHATASQIAAAAQVPRATAHRLLETLIVDGYVSRYDDIYSLKSRVAGLAGGLTAEARAADLGRPLVDALSEEIAWPIDILTPDGDALAVRHSTHGRCPRSLMPGSTAGFRASMLESAPGRIYLAMLPEAERRSFAEQPETAALMERTRALGYGSRDGGILPRTNSFAVAICAEGRPVACVSAMFMRAALPLEQAVERYLPAVRALADRVERDLAAA